MSDALTCHRTYRHGGLSYEHPARDYLAAGRDRRRALRRDVVRCHVRDRASPRLLGLAAVLALAAAVTGTWGLLLLAAIPAAHQAVVAAHTMVKVWPTYAFLADLAGPGLAALALDHGRRGGRDLDEALEDARQFAALLLLSRPRRCQPTHQFGCRHFPIDLDLAAVDRWWWHPWLRRFGRALRVSLETTNPWSPALRAPGGEGRS